MAQQRKTRINYTTQEKHLHKKIHLITKYFKYKNYNYFIDAMNTIVDECSKRKIACYSLNKTASRSLVVRLLEKKVFGKPIGGNRWHH